MEHNLTTPLPHHNNETLITAQPWLQHDQDNSTTRITTQLCLQRNQGKSTTMVTALPELQHNYVYNRTRATAQPWLQHNQNNSKTRTTAQWRLQHNQGYSTIMVIAQPWLKFNIHTIRTATAHTHQSIHSISTVIPHHNIPQSPFTPARSTNHKADSWLRLVLLCHKGSSEFTSEMKHVVLNWMLFFLVS